LFILIIYIAAHYSIVSINPVSFLLPGFISALVAGVVMEILLRGILFRITEQYLGTTIATIIISLLFVIMHSRADNATILSVTATTVQAGILLSSVYVFSRSLWFPIFLHFAWDFAEPAIFGGINPGISVGETLFTSNITGPELLTGGQNGPGNSIQAAGFCLFVSILFLLLAKKKGNIIKPFWK
ncbi:MAG: CPBP family intramembrane glutamic endopeptidase, partial [Bacteroidota bacterium]